MVWRMRECERGGGQAESFAERVTVTDETERNGKSIVDSLAKRDV